MTLAHDPVSALEQLAPSAPLASVAWLMASVDDWTDEEMQAVNGCVTTMLELGAASTATGRPSSLFASCLIGELVVGVVWRGGSDATFGFGRVDRAVDRGPGPTENVEPPTTDLSVRERAERDG